jgi:hypothetical protein
VTAPFERGQALTLPWSRGAISELLRNVSLRIAWQPDISREAMLLIGILVGLAQAGGWFAAPIDAVMYWKAGTSTDLYPESWSVITSGQLPYPPVIAQVSTVLQPIGWPAFVLLLTTATFVAFWFCARQWSLPLVLVGMPWLFGIGPDGPARMLTYALTGNVQWILAALTVLALRHPALWSIELVTKVTCAAGWWWHVLRGEWRAAATGAAVSLAIVALCFALAPALWTDYLGFAVRNFTAADPPIPTFPIPLGVRLATAVPLLIWGARTNRPWTVPMVCGWSLVGLYGFGFLPFWVAAWRVRAVGIVDRAPRSKSVPRPA